MKNLVADIGFLSFHLCTRIALEITGIYDIIVCDLSFHLCTRIALIVILIACYLLSSVISPMHTYCIDGLMYYCVYGTYLSFHLCTRIALAKMYKFIRMQMRIPAQ